MHVFLLEKFDHIFAIATRKSVAFFPTSKIAKGLRANAVEKVLLFFSKRTDIPFGMILMIGGDFF